MLRTCSRIIALTAMVAAALSMTVQAAEPETLTLACEGTVTDVGDGKSQPIAVVIIVNFKTRTVQGLSTILPLPMTYEDAKTIVFYEEVDRGSLGWISEYEGSINRLTGVLSAEEKRWKKTGQKVPSSLLSWNKYFLNCKPAQRMF